ncbi:hypothetical protein HDU83_002581 [Entophlyctis luteolus]|nr:hypothetical protein HDU83_002581 [Entophlyctis luteolus]
MSQAILKTLKPFGDSMKSSDKTFKELNENCIKYRINASPESSSQSFILYSRILAAMNNHASIEDKEDNKTAWDSSVWQHDRRVLAWIWAQAANNWSWEQVAEELTTCWMKYVSIHQLNQHAVDFIISDCHGKKILLSLISKAKLLDFVNFLTKTKIKNLAARKEILSALVAAFPGSAAHEELIYHKNQILKHWILLITDLDNSIETGSPTSTRTLNIDISDLMRKVLE